MRLNLVIIIGICLLPHATNAQEELIGFAGITEVRKMIFNGDSVTAIYQPDNIINVDRGRYPEYYRGLPDSLPSLPDGQYLLFNSPHDTTKIYLRERFFIKNNKRDSLWIKYDNNGKILSEKHYNEGNLNGIQREWDYFGNLTSELNVKDDTLDGEAFFYNELEGFYCKGTFSNNLKTGKWVYFYDSLTMFKTYIEQYYGVYEEFDFVEKVYRNDSLVEETYANEKGYNKYAGGVLVESSTNNKATRESRQLDKVAVKNEKPTIIRGIKFDNTLNHLDTSSYKSLLSIAKKASSKNDIIKLSFHTADDVGNVTPPWVFSVIDFFIKSGIDADRIFPVNYSNARPLITESKLSKIDNLCRRGKLKRKNQRIEYDIIKVSK